jgi:hypothetical protein
LKFAQNAILSLQASKSWLTLADVLTDLKRDLILINNALLALSHCESAIFLPTH